MFRKELSSSTEGSFDCVRCTSPLLADVGLCLRHVGPCCLLGI